jgi:hypothetical protein
MLLHDHRPDQHHALGRRVAIPELAIERSVVVVQLDLAPDAAEAAASRLHVAVIAHIAPDSSRRFVDPLQKASPR